MVLGREVFTQYPIISDALLGGECRPQANASLKIKLARQYFAPNRVYVSAAIEMSAAEAYKRSKWGSNCENCYEGLEAFQRLVGVGEPKG